MATDINLVKGMSEAIEELLRDERWPDQNFCSVCLLGFGRLIGNNAPSIPIVQTKYHGFLDACMRYLTIPRDAREKKILSRRLRHSITHCQLIIGDYQTHEDKIRKWDHTHIDDPREMMQSLLGEILFSCLYGFDRTSDSATARSPVARALNPHKPFRSVAGAWPTNIDQLFPFGPEQTVDAVVEACCFFASRSPLSVLCAILELARPRVWDVLLLQKNHQRLAWALVVTLLLGIPGGDAQLALQAHPSPPGCTIPARWKDATWLRDGKGLQAAVTVFESLRGGNYAHPDDVLRFAAPYAHLLAPALTFAMAHYRTTTPALCGTFEFYLSTLQRAAEVAELTPALDEEDLARVLTHVVAVEPRHLAMLRMIRLAVNWLIQERHCAGPGCARTMLDLGKPLSTCARCQLARYCSRPCQQADWKSGVPVPHKLICDALAKLRASDRLDSMTENEYIGFVEKTGISDEQIAMVGRWALSRGQVMQHHLRVVIVTSSQVSEDQLANLHLLDCAVQVTS